MNLFAPTRREHRKDGIFRANTHTRAACKTENCTRDFDERNAHQNHVDRVHDLRKNVAFHTHSSTKEYMYLSYYGSTNRPRDDGQIWFYSEAKSSLGHLLRPIVCCHNLTDETSIGRASQTRLLRRLERAFRKSLCAIFNKLIADSTMESSKAMSWIEQLAADSRGVSLRLGREARVACAR